MGAEKGSGKGVRNHKFKNNLGMIDNTGTTIDHIQYDSFGNIASRTSSTYDLRFGYTGRELADEAGDGMWYYRRRFYDSTVGRFITQGPAASLGVPAFRLGAAPLTCTPSRPTIKSAITTPTLIEAGT